MSTVHFFFRDNSRQVKLNNILMEMTIYIIFYTENDIIE